jgi:uncharacterized protein
VIPLPRLFLTALLALIAAPLAAQPAPPIMTARVMDEAGLLTPEAVAEVEAELAIIAEKTGVHFLILTSPDLKGEDPVAVATRRLIEWQQGKPRPIIGTLYLVAPNDRVTAVTANHMLPPGTTAADLTDEMAQNLTTFTGNMERATVVVIRPLLRAGDWDGAMRAFAKLAASEATSSFPKRAGQ